MECLYVEYNLSGETPILLKFDMIEMKDLKDIGDEGFWQSERGKNYKLWVDLEKFSKNKMKIAHHKIRNIVYNLAIPRLEAKKWFRD